MTSRWLTEYVEPYRLGARNGVLDGRIPIARFPRLAALFDAADSGVSAQVQFSRDDHGRCQLQGELSLEGQLFCNRCAQLVPLRLAASVDVRIVATDEEAREMLPEQDPMVLPDEQTSLAGLLEDDLLLSLPDVGCSDRDTCPRRPATGEVAAPAAREQQAGPADNPFKVLEQLKRPADN